MLETPLTTHDLKPTFHKPPSTLADPFVFVPITQQEAAKGRGAAKRIVRAHVTRVQHAKSSTLSSTQDLQSWTVKPYLHRDSAAVRRKARANSELVKRRTHISPDKSDDTTEYSQAKSVALVPKLPAGGAGDDPFWTYPVEYQPYLAPIFAHCQFPHYFISL